MDELRQALRRLAKAVVIITSYRDGERFAMSATAVSELSLDPPSMLICVNRNASIYPALADGASFAINILPCEERALAGLCAGGAKGEARFEAGSWEASADNIPILANAQASIICSNERLFEYGTHVVVIGKVTQVALGGPPNPLIYMDGGYTQVAAAPAHA